MLLSHYDVRFKPLLMHKGRARLSLVDLEQCVLSDARLLEDCARGAFLERVPLVDRDRDWVATRLGQHSMASALSVLLPAEPHERSHQTCRAELCHATHRITWPRAASYFRLGMRARARSHRSSLPARVTRSQLQ